MNAKNYKQSFDFILSRMDHTFSSNLQDISNLRDILYIFLQHEQVHYQLYGWKNSNFLFWYFCFRVHLWYSTGGLNSLNCAFIINSSFLLLSWIILRSHWSCFLRYSWYHFNWVFDLVDLIFQMFCQKEKCSPFFCNLTQFFLIPSMRATWLVIVSNVFSSLSAPFFPFSSKYTPFIKLNDSILISQPKLK